MPIVLIILAVATLFGIGSYFLKPSDVIVPEQIVYEVPSTPTTVLAKPNVVTPPESPIDTESTNPTNPIKSTRETPEPVTPTPTPVPKPITPTPVPPPVVVQKSTYKDGTYTVTSSYVSPGRSTHNVIATLKLENDTVTEARVSYSGDDVETSTQYQSKFSRSYQSEVIGKKIDSISLSRTGGASLTSAAFNKAITELKTTARS